MKVCELIEILEQMDAEADVILLFQKHWPLESGLAGICQRSDLVEGDEPDEDEAPATGGEKLPANDVFLVEGTQLRYGNKRAWDVARRW